MSENKLPPACTATPSRCARRCPQPVGRELRGLFLTSGFVQPDAETMAHRFANPQEGYTYGRTSNPTVTSFEQRLAAMEGTEAAIGTATGMAAILLLGMGLLKAGDHVVCSRSVFGSTLNLFAKEFGKFAVESTFVSQTDLQEWKAAVRPNTRLLFAETPTNAHRRVRHPRAGRHRPRRRRAAGGQLLLAALQRGRTGRRPGHPPAPSTSTARAA